MCKDFSREKQTHLGGTFPYTLCTEVPTHWEFVFHLHEQTHIQANQVQCIQIQETVESYYMKL